MATCSQVRRIQ